MVVALAFVATVVSSLFAQAMLVRSTQGHRPEHRAWAVALGMFALASAALATGTSTGWDRGTFRVFYLLGAVVNVPWLAAGTVFLLASERVARRAQWGLVLFTGFAAGRRAERTHGWRARHCDPRGEGRFRCVATGAGGGRQRRRRDRDPGGRRSHRRCVSRATGVRPTNGRRARANGPHRVGHPGAVERRPRPGAIGHDEAFTLSLAVGISIVYWGFVLAGARGDDRSGAALDSAPATLHVP